MPKRFPRLEDIALELMGAPKIGGTEREPIPIFIDEVLDLFKSFKGLELILFQG